jgi:hypothetical protein
MLMLGILVRDVLSVDILREAIEKARAVSIARNVASN